jgi:hypothetical protein
MVMTLASPREPLSKTTAAGSLIDQWAVAPELVGKVRPTHYDADSGQLDLLPIFSPAYATQLRLLGRQMITRINTKSGAETVRSIRVLPPGGSQTPQTETPREREPAPPVSRARSAPGRPRQPATARPWPHTRRPSPNRPTRRSDRRSGPRSNARSRLCGTNGSRNRRSPTARPCASS